MQWERCFFVEYLFCEIIGSLSEEKVWTAFCCHGFRWWPWWSGIGAREWPHAFLATVGRVSFSVVWHSPLRQVCLTLDPCLLSSALVPDLVLDQALTVTLDWSRLWGLIIIRNHLENCFGSSPWESIQNQTSVRRQKSPSQDSKQHLWPQLEEGVIGLWPLLSSPQAPSHSSV